MSSDLIGLSFSFCLMRMFENGYYFLEFRSPNTWTLAALLEKV